MRMEINKLMIFYVATVEVAKQFFYTINLSLPSVSLLQLISK